jgi:hypothetical protein
METIWSASQLSQPPTAGEVISLDVGIDHIFDLHSFGFGELDVGLNVCSSWVHDRGPRSTRSTQDVSSAT